MAPTIGIAVDHRRQNLSEEGIAANIQRLKDFKARLILFPRKSNKAKKADTPKDQRNVETTQTLSSVLPTVSGFSEIKKSEIPKAAEGGAYKTLREARSSARYAGVREKRAKDKADAEQAKK